MDRVAEERLREQYARCDAKPFYSSTHVVGAYMDKHMVFQLLQFMETNEVFAKTDVVQAQLELIGKTNMVEFEIELHEGLHGEAPKAMADRKAAVLHRLDELNEYCEPILAVINGEGVVEQLKADGAYTAEHLLSAHGVTEDHVEELYVLAKFSFECGSYAEAGSYLAHYRALTKAEDNSFSALWGQYAADLLVPNWDAALEDMEQLREEIETRSFESPLQQLQQRTWLMHWSLFVYFKHPLGRNAIVDMLFNERYMNALTTNCPHMLRYLAAAVITNKRRRNKLEELVKVIQQERYAYSDPITEFLECLYVNFDFESAQQKLRDCEAVLDNDYFLAATKDEFIENARLFVFETYCRIHQCIDIALLAEKLNMDPEAAERWIVNLVREANLDAKIDSNKHQVLMGVQRPNIYQQVIEKTQGLAFRSYVLAGNVDRAAKTKQGKQQGQQLSSSAGR